MRETPWKLHPVRAELLVLYKEVDELLAPWSCPSSTDCCRFGVTGREPYPHTVELAEVEHALRARPPKRSLALPIAEERRCPMLGDDGRCTIYASRPFGCRTFFCENVQGPGKFPRERVAALGRRVADLSSRAFPRDPGPRPLTKALPVGGPRALR